MEYNNYDELIKGVRVFRLEHKDLTPDDLDKLILRRFKIDRTVDLLPARVTMTSERFPIRLDEGRSLYEG